MNNIIGPSIAEISFNEAVENIKAIAREARHMGTSKEFSVELPKFLKFIDDVNFKVFFVKDPENYLRTKMLDTMDYIVDNWLANNEKFTNNYRVANSIYDVIKNWYFNF